MLYKSHTQHVSECFSGACSLWIFNSSI